MRRFWMMPVMIFFAISARAEFPGQCIQIFDLSGDIWKSQINEVYRHAISDVDRADEIRQIFGATLNENVAQISDRSAELRTVYDANAEAANSPNKWSAAKTIANFNISRAAKKFVDAAVKNFEILGKLHFFEYQKLMGVNTREFAQDFIADLVPRSDVAKSAYSIIDVVRRFAPESLARTTILDFYKLAQADHMRPTWRYEDQSAGQEPLVDPQRRIQPRYSIIVENDDFILGARPGQELGSAFSELELALMQKSRSPNIISGITYYPVLRTNIVVPTINDLQFRGGTIANGLLTLRWVRQSEIVSQITIDLATLQIVGPVQTIVYANGVARPPFPDRLLTRMLDRFRQALAALGAQASAQP